MFLNSLMCVSWLCVCVCAQGSGCLDWEQTVFDFFGPPVRTFCQIYTNWIKINVDSWSKTTLSSIFSFPWIIIDSMMHVCQHTPERPSFTHSSVYIYHVIKSKFSPEDLRPQFWIWRRKKKETVLLSEDKGIHTPSTCKRFDEMISLFSSKLCSFSFSIS